MPMKNPPLETELKIPVDDHATVIEQLGALHAERVMPPSEEHNALFDFADGRLSLSGSTLRLRRFGSRWLFTFKGPATYTGPVKRREELETDIDDGEVMVVILGRLGLEPRVRYEKIRETWRLEGVEIALDRTPMGCFVELEGPVERLETLARRLSLDPSRAVRGSYVSLWQQYRADHPEMGLPRDMVFAE